VKRREFIAGLGGAAAWSLAARAQQSAQRMRRIGMLNGFDADNPLFRSFVADTIQALAQLGWEIGRNVEFIERWSGGDADRTTAMAKELVALQPDVIFAEARPTAASLQRETRSIPVVFLDSDPVGSGLVASLAHPGGNLTGIAFSEETFAGKLLSLLRSAAPRIERAAVMLNPDNAGRSATYHVEAFQTAARALAIEPVTAHVRSDDDIEEMITSLGRERGGLVAVPNGFMNIHRATVIASSLRNRVPVIFDGTNFAKQGGLLQYGPDFRALQRRVAYYLDRILRGTKPSDLAVELPIKYLLVINLRTAKAIDLDVSADMISIADEVVE
jgi:putative tryptophan/tyrosine transport system substrate-binding protein